MKYIIDKNNKKLKFAIAIDNYIPTANEIVIETELVPTNIVNAWDDTEWVEMATEQEIEALEKQKQLSQMQDFLTKKKADGENYYNEIELALTIVLAGLPIQSLIPVNHEIETEIKPIINEIKVGDWFNAYMKLWITENYTRPQSNLLTQTFDNIKVRVKQYFETNYPR